MMGMGRGGRTYKVLISDLLDSLKTNRDEHAAIIEEAQAKFRVMAIEEIDKMLVAAKAGKAITMRVNLAVPTKHLDAFDNAIGLMELTQKAGEEAIEIDADEYERFVRNRWEWMDAFRSSNRAYSSAL
jgi:hypothetical protein